MSEASPQLTHAVVHAVQAVQIDPDAEAAQADGKPAAAMLCGGPPQAEKSFDF